MKFNLDKLPHILVKNRDKLPNHTAVYIVVADEKVLYVGKAKDLNQRWMQHHRYQQLNKFIDSKIYWINTEIDAIESLEKTLIRELKPILNNTKVLDSRRMRADIWVNLQSRIESEIERTGLSVNEVVNMALADYFGLSPRGRVQGMPQPNLPPSTSHYANLPASLPQPNLPPSAQPQTVDDEDYI
ncbi:MAG: GIY-YIG nuclease family protein [Cyanobacteria bacterium J06628_3]